MKKVIISAVVMGVAAIAAQAQTTYLYNTEAKYLMQEQRRQRAQVNSVQKAVEREAVRQARAQRRRERVATDTTTVPPSVTQTQTPAARQNQTTTKAPAIGRQNVKTVVRGSKTGVWDYVKAVFGAAPFPGESNQVYQTRVRTSAYAATQPFK